MLPDFNQSVIEPNYNLHLTISKVEVHTNQSSHFTLQSLFPQSLAALVYTKCTVGERKPENVPLNALQVGDLGRFLNIKDKLFSLENSDGKIF